MNRARVARHRALARGKAPAVVVSGRRCEICGRDLPIESGRRYCRDHPLSSRPWAKAYNKRRRAEYIPAEPKFTFTCDACGFGPQLTHQANQRFCSQTCAYRSRQRALRTVFVNKHWRQKVLERDAWQCYLCSRPIRRDVAYPHPASGTVDHVVPVAMGGTNALTNLRAAHWECNRAKGDELPPWWVSA